MADAKTARYNLRLSRNVQYRAVYLLNTIVTGDAPSLREALESQERSEWLAAARQNFETFTFHGTWKIAKPPPHVRPLPSATLLRHKRVSRGHSARFKARPVARGNLQSAVCGGWIRWATCSVAWKALDWLLLSLAGSKSFADYRLDVKGAFLHNSLPLSNHIWIRLPSLDGVQSARDDISLLVKSLYSNS